MSIIGTSRIEIGAIRIKTNNYNSFLLKQLLIFIENLMIVLKKKNYKNIYIIYIIYFIKNYKIYNLKKYIYINLCV